MLGFLKRSVIGRFSVGYRGRLRRLAGRLGWDRKTSHAGACLPRKRGE